MSKKSHKALASATVMSLVLTSALTATNNVQAAAKVERMPGADRFATAQEVAKQSFGKAENVVLVNGLGYADAVSATPLAKQLDAPILLTDAEDKPSAKLVATLTDLGAKNVYIIGGTGVVTEAMEKELAKTYKVERIAGDAKDGRYGTNAAVAKKVIEKTKATEGILVSAEGYADALSVASIAATKGMPVLFANKNEVPAVVKDAAKDMKKIMAVGGEGVLPDAVLKVVNAERIAKGADRFETNLTVLKHFGADLKFDNIFVAAGGDDSKSKFADALVASAAAAKFGAPVVLNGLGANETRIKEAIKFTKDHMGDNTKVTIVGGEASVSKDIENELAGKKASTGKAEVQSMEGLNLNQVKVVFADKVDADTAEDVKNYELDGEQLTETTAVAQLKDDDRTVVITLADIQAQEKEKTLKVRKGILNKEKSKLVSESEKKVTFKDVVAPKLEKVSVKGNTKVGVEFSEAVFVEGKDEEAVIKNLAQQIEINGDTIESIGYNGETDGNGKLKYTKLKNSIKVKDGYYVNKVEFYFDSALDNGTNQLKVLEGKKDRYLVDAAGFTMKEAKQEFKVEKVDGKPKVKSVKGSTEGKIFINFDRPMDKKTATDSRNYELNGSQLSLCDAKVELKEGDTQVKISKVSGVLTGSNTITIDNKVRDAFGNKVEDDTRIAFTAEKDNVKPKVNYVLTVDESTLRVVFSKDVKEKVATDKSNYTLKDSKGNKISIKEIKSVAECNDMYDIELSDNKKLDGSKYTLKIENVIDGSGNVMDDYTTTINGSDVVPTIKKAVAVKNSKGEYVENKIVVVFDQEMKSSTIDKTENYRYKNDKNEVKALPSDSKITVASDNKTVTIELPESYHVMATGTKAKSNLLKSIVITKDVESINGVKMDADETVSIQEVEKESTVKLVKDPVTLKSNGDDVTLRIRFNGAIDRIDNKEDFKFKDRTNEIKGEIKPTTVVARGEVVEFKFTDENADNAKAAGVDLQMTSKGIIKDFAGQSIEFSLDDVSKVNTSEIAPKLDYNKKDGFVDWKTNSDENTVTVRFNTKIDKDTINKDDFTFVSNNQSKLKVVEKPIVKGNTAIFKFEEDIKENEEITIKVDKNQNIKSKEDGNGDNVKYSPDYVEDNDGIKVKVDAFKSNPIAEGDKDQKVDEAVKKDELNKLVAEAKEAIKDEAKYTEESVKAVKDVLTKVENLDAKADQNAVNALVKELNDAKAKLAEKAEASKDEFSIKASTFEEGLMSNNLYIEVSKLEDVIGVTVDGKELQEDDRYLKEDGKLNIVFKKGTPKEKIGEVVIKTVKGNITLDANNIK